MSKTSNPAPIDTDQQIRDRFSKSFTAVVDRTCDTLLSITQPGNLGEIMEQIKNNSANVSSVAYQITEEGREFKKATEEFIERFGVTEYLKATGYNQSEVVTSTERDISFRKRMEKLIVS